MVMEINHNIKQIKGFLFAITVVVIVAVALRFIGFL